MCLFYDLHDIIGVISSTVSRSAGYFLTGEFVDNRVPEDVIEARDALNRTLIEAKPLIIAFVDRLIADLDTIQHDSWNVKKDAFQRAALRRFEEPEGPPSPVGRERCRPAPLDEALRRGEVAWLALGFLDPFSVNRLVDQLQAIKELLSSTIMFIRSGCQNLEAFWDIIGRHIMSANNIPKMLGPFFCQMLGCLKRRENEQQTVCSEMEDLHTLNLAIKFRKNFEEVDDNLDCQQRQRLATAIVEIHSATGLLREKLAAETDDIQWVLDQIGLIKPGM